MIFKKIREILESTNLDIADKLCEIEMLIPKERKIVTNKTSNAIFNDSEVDEYIDNPRLENEDDLYYTGAGCAYGTDLDGKRYWKRYCATITEKDMRNMRYRHLMHGDIIDEKARIKKIVMECLNGL